MATLALGLSLGLAAGMVPGPHLIYVVTATLRGGWRPGVLAACAPLITDVLVVGVTLLVLDQLPGAALRWLGAVGGCFVIWTGLGIVRELRAGGAGLSAVTEPEAQRPAAHALRSAMLINLLSPHPWLTWASVLGPLALAAWRDESPVAGLGLGIGFYLALIGTKVLIASLVAGGRRRLGARGYRRALAGAGWLLIASGVLLLVEFWPL